MKDLKYNLVHLDFGFWTNQNYGTAQLFIGPNSSAIKILFSSSAKIGFSRDIK